MESLPQSPAMPDGITLPHLCNTAAAGAVRGERHEGAHAAPAIHSSMLRTEPDSPYTILHGRVCSVVLLMRHPPPQKTTGGWAVCTDNTASRYPFFRNHTQWHVEEQMHHAPATSSPSFRAANRRHPCNRTISSRYLLLRIGCRLRHACRSASGEPLLVLPQWAA